MPGQIETLNLLLAERERRNRLRQHAEGPKYDWFGPDCGCPKEARRENGSCPTHPRARDKQRPPEGDWRVWGILAGRGFGKALALDTPIPTPSGWKTMGDLEVGDVVYDEAGQQTPITFVSPVMVGNECFDVIFSDGSVITADGDHEWLTWTHAARKAKSRRVPDEAIVGERKPQQRPRVHPCVVTTRKIKETLHHGNGKRIENNHSISLCGPLGNPPADLPIDPYVLGVWLGDGSSSEATIACNDPEIVEEVEKAGYRATKYAADYMYGIGPARRWRNNLGQVQSEGGLKIALRTLGVLGNKHVPDAYLLGSIEQRQALLEGLMDTDGTVGKGGSCCFDNTNKRLSDAVAELVVSLGFKVTRATKRATLYGLECGDCYRVMFTPHRRVFRLPRKVARQKLDRVRKTQFHRYIVDVKPRPSVAVRCIEVGSANHLFLAGRSCIPTHNTRSGAPWVNLKAEQSPKGTRIAIVAPIARDVRKVMVEGPAGILACSAPWFMPEYFPSKCEVHWPNGVIGDTYAAEDPDRMRGHNSSYAWCDELAAWGNPEVWDMLMLGLRIGENPQCMFTTTPRPFKWLKRIYNSSRTVIVRGSTYENKDNLSSAFIADMEQKYGGTKLGRQELNAEDIEDVDGALWTTDLIKQGTPPAEFDRIVVAIDPTSRDPGDRDDDQGDEAGIIVVGCCVQTHATLGEVTHAYLIEDRTMTGSPHEWAQEAIDAYDFYGADVIVAETNNGGDMVRGTIHAIDPNVNFKKLWASRGKAIRAEPIQSLYEQGRVFHCREFPELEAEMTTWVPRMRMPSPNRLDAMVWGVTEAVLEGMPWTEGAYPFSDYRG